MRGHSELQALQCDLFLVLARMDDTELDEIVDAWLFRLKPRTEAAKITIPRSRKLQTLYEYLLSNRGVFEL
ncbi:hypothetical protein VP01_513g4 [Puccinia sorghi]|uniref:Uncharacterized protein n=1 Tax=Puccinia sorghi TaxID=27349 RepID=A0A0L6ULS1_9BASI|nr:hypothetical protein VP01_513g4 [Puccinia sorghi]